MQKRTQPYTLHASRFTTYAHRETPSLSVRVMLILACLTAFSGSNALAATYYVSPSGSDSNPGTQSSPWRTIQKAASTLTAGDTAIVMDGTYEENSITFANSGTSDSQRITIKAQNSRRAILSSLSTGSCSPGISISKSYITIEGLRLSVSPRASSCGVYSSANVGIRAWEQNLPNINGPQSTGYVGVHIRDVQVDMSPLRDIGIKTNQDYALIEDSTIYDEIEAFNSRGVIYRNNVVWHGGACCGNYISGKGGVRDMQIYGNIVHMTTVRMGNPSWQLGLSCGQVSGVQWDYDPSTAWEAYNCVAYNNVIINETGAASVIGMMSQGATDSAFYNNILINATYYNGKGGGGNYPRNITLKNNIFLCGGGSAIGGSVTGTFTADYNNFYNCSGAPSQAHPITGDPRFVNSASDWHLQAGSPALGSGVAVTFSGYNGSGPIDVSKDKDGVTRTVPWSLGIYRGSSSSADTTPPPAPTGFRVL